MKYAFLMRGGLFALHLAVALLVLKGTAVATDLGPIVIGPGGSSGFNPSVTVNSGATLTGGRYTPALSSDYYSINSWGGGYIVNLAGGTVTGPIGGGQSGTLNVTAGTMTGGASGALDIYVTGTMQSTISGSTISGGGVLDISGSTGTKTVTSVTYNNTGHLTVHGDDMNFIISNITLNGTNSTAELRSGTNTSIKLTGGGNKFTLGNHATNPAIGAKLEGTNTIDNGEVNISGGYLTSLGTLATTDGTVASEWNLTGGTATGSLLLGASTDTVNISGDNKTASTFGPLNNVYTLIENKAGNAIFNIRGGHTVTIDSTAGTGNSKYNLHDFTHNVVINGDTVYGRYDTSNQVIKNIYGDATDTLDVYSKATYSSGTGAITALANGKKEYLYDKTNDLNAYVDKITVDGTDAIATVKVHGGTETAHTTLEIGSRATGTYWFDVDDVVVESYGDLFIHKSTDGHVNLVKTISASGLGARIWLDDSMLGNSTNQVSVTIDSGATLTGFADVSSYNIYGNVLNKAGGTIKPYDVGLNDTTDFYTNITKEHGQDESSRGTVISGGNLTMEGDSRLAVRLFADQTGTIDIVTEWIDNGNGYLADVGSTQTVALSKGDYVNVTDGKAIFQGTAKLDPTFGNDNELANKRAFALYTGTGEADDNVNTYYYNIMKTTDAIDAGALNADLFARDPTLAVSGLNIKDNVLFDNQIVKSDMLGEWTFVLSDDGENILLRFRLLAQHPTDGGIAIDMQEPNAAEAAKQIDRIRYPFSPDDQTRYNGDMWDYYKDHKAEYPNAQELYIKDWEKLLLAIQNEITTGANLNQSIRQLHPEPYADMADVTVTAARRFRNTVEQNGVSSLFMVEAENYNYAVAEAQAEGNYEALANLALEEVGVDQFVCNPLRFWASAFGSTGHQNKIGTEYGWENELWGGAVGVVKEWGDFYGGLTMGYARMDTEWSDLHASAKTDAYMADVVVGWRRGLGFLELFGTFSYNEQDMNRYIDISSYSGTARGKYENYVYGGGFRMGYQVVMGEWLFIPTIGINYMRTESGSFSETGRAWMSTLLDFRSGDIKRQNLQVPIAFRLNRSFAVCDSVVTPELRGSFTPIFGQRRASATARFVGDPSMGGQFTAVGIDSGRYEASVGASVELSRRGRLHASANYDLFLRKESYEHNYSLRLGMNF